MADSRQTDAQRSACDSIAIKSFFRNRRIPLADSRVSLNISLGLDNLIDWNVVAPRVGAIYQATNDGRTVVKIHYGR